MSTSPDIVVEVRHEMVECDKDGKVLSHVNDLLMTTPTECIPLKTFLCLYYKYPPPPQPILQPYPHYKAQGWEGGGSRLCPPFLCHMRE